MIGIDIGLYRLGGDAGLADLLGRLAATVCLAQADGGGGGGGAPPNPMSSMMFMLVAMFAVMYFLVIRPGQKDQERRARFLENLKKGDRVSTAGGLIGKVAEIREREIVLKIDDSNGTRVHVYKAAIRELMDAKKEEGDKTEKPDKPEAAGGDKPSA